MCEYKCNRIREYKGRGMYESKKVWGYVEIGFINVRWRLIMLVECVMKLEVNVMRLKKLEINVVRLVKCGVYKCERYNRVIKW